MACKYCGKPSRGEYCSFNCAGMDEKRHEEQKEKLMNLRLDTEKWFKKMDKEVYGKQKKLNKLLVGK